MSVGEGEGVRKGPQAGGISGALQTGYGISGKAIGELQRRNGGWGGQKVRRKKRSKNCPSRGDRGALEPSERERKGIHMRTERRLRVP